jgi:hypothetical protein
MEGKCCVDRRRDRTCNLLIRSQAPCHWASRPVVDERGRKLGYMYHGIEGNLFQGNSSRPDFRRFSAEKVLCLEEPDMPLALSFR